MRKLISLFLTLLLLLSLMGTVYGTWEAEALPAETVEAEPLDPRIEAVLAWALEIAADDSHGYSQRDRFGPNYDCTSFVSTALMEGGFALEDCLSTGGMLRELPELGFAVYRTGETEPQRGDLLIQLGSHAELCMGDGACVAAHQSYDRWSGDSTGHEIEYRSPEGDYGCSFCKYRQYNYILRYEGAEEAQTPVPPLETVERELQ